MVLDPIGVIHDPYFSVAEGGPETFLRRGDALGRYTRKPYGSPQRALVDNTRHDLVRDGFGGVAVLMDMSLGELGVIAIARIDSICCTYLGASYLNTSALG